MYYIYLNGDLICQTDWPPMAQAAWNRAARDRDSAQHGGEAMIKRDNDVLARVRPRMKDGHPWPDAGAAEATWHDVVRQLMLMLRDDGLSARDIADAMTDMGLPTTRSRVDALRGSSRGKRTEVVPAELVTMIAAIIAQRAQDSDDDTPAEH